MKFCDKLVKLRKENNLSQEQLADRMSLSRQAVSKWELGSSVPDTKTMIDLCKVLNCNIDDLLDDDIVGEMNVNKNNKGNVNTYLNDLLKFITKIYNMFCSMTFKEKIKCIFEMCILLSILYAAFAIFGEVLENLFRDLFNFINYDIYSVIEGILSFIYATITITGGLIIFIHLFKIRYLDYYVTVEDKNVSIKNIEIPVDDKKTSNCEYTDSKKDTKIIIRDPKHSTYSFMTGISKLIILCIKFFVAFFMFMFAIVFITIVSSTGYALILLNNGLVFLGFAIFGIGLLASNYILLELSYKFIFNMKYAFKRCFIIFICSLLLIGIGGAISFNQITNFEIIDFKDEQMNDLTKTNEKIVYSDNLVISFIDEAEIIFTSGNEIEIELSYPKNFRANTYQYENYHDNKLYQVVRIYYDLEPFSTYRLFLEGIKNKKLYDLDNQNVIIKISLNENTYNKIKENMTDLHEN